MPFNLGDSNKDAKEKCYLSYILSSLKFVFSDLVYICFHFLTVAFFLRKRSECKKKKGIGASIWLPQYFLFGILGIQGYLTLSIRFKLALQR